MGGRRAAAAGKMSGAEREGTVKVVPWLTVLSTAMRAAVQPDEFLHQGEADAAALVRAAARPRCGGSARRAAASPRPEYRCRYR